MSYADCMKKKIYPREVFDDDMLTLLEDGRVVATLSGTNVVYVAPQNLKPHHHIITAQEAARRLNLKHLPPRRGFLERLLGKK